MANGHSFDCFSLGSSPLGVAFDETCKAWDNDGRVLYVASSKKENALRELCCSQLIIVLHIENGNLCKNPSMLYICSHEEFPLTSCCRNKKAMADDAVVVGYIMKSYRVKDCQIRALSACLAWLHLPYWELYKV